MENYGHADKGVRRGSTGWTGEHSPFNAASGNRILCDCIFWGGRLGTLLEGFRKSAGKIETRLRRVELVPSAYPCHKEQDDNYLRIVPGMYPDLLRDLDTEGDGADKKYLTKEVPGQWRSLWLDVTVDAELAGGDYAIMIETETEDGEKETLKADLHVVDASLPPQKLLHTEWFHSDCLADYYHVKPFSEEHWKILENFIRLYAARGINTILTPVFTPPLDTAVGGERTTVQLLDIRKDGDTYSFDFSKLERWIGICRFAGITHFEWRICLPSGALSAHRRLWSGRTARFAISLAGTRMHRARNMRTFWHNI